MSPTDTHRADPPDPAETDRTDAGSSDEATGLVAEASRLADQLPDRGPCADAAALLRLLKLLLSVLTTLATLAALLR